MIEVRDLVKRYGEVPALAGVSFSAERGQVTGLLGPNGAGKSTAMRVLTGWISASSGDARVAGFDVATSSIEVRRRLGYLAENVALYSEMRVAEYLAFRAAMKGVPRGSRRRRVARSVEHCGLGDVMRRIVGQLSKGYRQRVGLAAVLLHDPEVLILDEPTVGLDPNQIAELRALIKDLGRERTVLLSTHVLSDAESVCDRVVIIDRGRVLADGTPAELATRARATSLRLEVVGEAEATVRAMERLGFFGFEILSREPTVRLRLHGTGQDDRREAVSRAVSAAGGVVIELAVESSRLDETFARITAGPESEP